jgi:hypothetical protein
MILKILILKIIKKINSTTGSRLAHIQGEGHISPEAVHKVQTDSSIPQ